MLFLHLEQDKDGKMNVKKSGNLSLEEHTRMIMTSFLHELNMRATTKEIKEELYDYANIVFSSFLTNFIPDKELRKDLTAETLLEMENKYLNEKF